MESKVAFQLSNLSLLPKYADNVVVTQQECSAKTVLVLKAREQKIWK